MQKPDPATFPGFFNDYIALVPENDLATALHNQTIPLQEFLSAISEEKSQHSYASDKWTLKDILQHLIDSERIFSYRAMCIARGEQQALPGFDQDVYALNANARERNWQSMANEMLLVRQSTLALFHSLTDEMLCSEGTANHYHINVAGIGFILLGHMYHHLNVVNEKYLS